MSQNDSSSSGLGQITLHDALDYVNAVKIRFARKPAVYNQFLNILAEFKAQRIDTLEVIQRVGFLFQGYNDLILGFDTFLPPNYKIECRDDPRTGGYTVGVSAPDGTFSMLEEPSLHRRCTTFLNSIAFSTLCSKPFLIAQSLFRKHSISDVGQCESFRASIHLGALRRLFIDIKRRVVFRIRKHIYTGKSSLMNGEPFPFIYHQVNNGKLLMKHGRIDIVKIIESFSSKMPFSAINAAILNGDGDVEVLMPQFDNVYRLDNSKVLVCVLEDLATVRAMHDIFSDTTSILDGRTIFVHLNLYTNILSGDFAASFAQSLTKIFNYAEKGVPIRFVTHDVLEGEILRQFICKETRAIFDTSGVMRLINVIEHEELEEKMTYWTVTVRDEREAVDHVFPPLATSVYKMTLYLIKHSLSVFSESAPSCSSKRHEHSAERKSQPSTPVVDNRGEEELIEKITSVPVQEIALNIAHQSGEAHFESSVVQANLGLKVRLSQDQNMRNEPMKRYKKARLEYSQEVVQLICASNNAVKTLQKKWQQDVDLSKTHMEELKNACKCENLMLY